MILDIEESKMLTVKCLNKIFSWNTGLSADSPQSRGFYSGMIRNSHRSDSAIRIFSLERNMITLPNYFKPQCLKSMKNFLEFCIDREFIQEIATSVSAIKASFGKFVFLITLEPNVLMWNNIADFVSAKACSYVLPSPTTTPSNPSGYPTYPSSSFEMTILNFLNRCIFIPPEKKYSTGGSLCQGVKK